ncbi:hypothetical protein [Treponema primitia]|uniref:hypothetical protein n=1 Tax=Treponema primitia TaxID=88058 RepID=UPI0002554E42|nr:hypothetical protein [Treponema primitia]
MMFPIDIEGIDKIKVTLNPIWLNCQDELPHVDTHNHLTLHRCGVFASLAIEAEFMNLLVDYRTNIVIAICELIKRGIITFFNNSLTPYFVTEHLDYFVTGIQEIEFYFDLRPCHITMNEEGNLVKFDKGYYTPDYNKGKKNKRKSIGIVYDKNEKNKKDNHIKRTNIDNWPFKTRLEFRLTSRNCKYLSIENLRGPYSEVIKRFTPYLAVQYGLYFKDNVKVTGRDNKRLKQIVKKAESAGKRYTGKELKKTESVNAAKNATNDDARKTMQRFIKAQFFREKRKEENASKGASIGQSNIQELVNLAIQGEKNKTGT